MNGITSWRDFPEFDVVAAGGTRHQACTCYHLRPPRNKSNC
jgi:hypothetical protein